MEKFVQHLAGCLIIGGKILLEVEIKYFQGYLETIAHIIMQLGREGGFEGSVDSALNKSQEIRIRKIEDFARKRVEKGVTLM